MFPGTITYMCCTWNDRGTVALFSESGRVIFQGFSSSTVWPCKTNLSRGLINDLTREELNRNWPFGLTLTVNVYCVSVHWKALYTRLQAVCLPCCCCKYFLGSGLLVVVWKREQGWARKLTERFGAEPGQSERVGGAMRGAGWMTYDTPWTMW